MLGRYAEGNGTPLQYFCLENPMDGGAWWAAVHGVSNSPTRLSNFTITFHSHALQKEMAAHSSVLAWRISGREEPGCRLWGCTESDMTEATWRQQQIDKIKLQEYTMWAGRQEGGSGWGTHVNPWLIHVNVWQKPLQYCKIISLQLIKINEINEIK